MRSRFSAYALSLVEYIVDTTDPSGPMWQADGVAWRAEIHRFCRDTRFRELRVLERGQEGDEGRVRFRCLLVVGQEEAELSEDSRFCRVDGRWLYHSARAPG